MPICLFHTQVCSTCSYPDCETVPQVDFRFCVWDTFVGKPCNYFQWYSQYIPWLRIMRAEERSHATPTNRIASFSGHWKAWKWEELRKRSKDHTNNTPMMKTLCAQIVQMVTERQQESIRTVTVYPRPLLSMCFVCTYMYMCSWFCVWTVLCILDIFPFDKRFSLVLAGFPMRLHAATFKLSCMWCGCLCEEQQGVVCSFMCMSLWLCDRM